MMFSVIIPVYNVAPYLRECLDSLIDQSFADWEAVCVDDGSTDGSETILDEYAAKDARFRVIHQENAGVSCARNRGLDNICGNYFLFLDGDDLFRSNALMSLKDLLDKGSYDALHISGSFSNIPSSWTTVIPSPRLKFLTSCDAGNGYICGRVYKTSVFGACRFIPGMRYREDLCFWSDCLSLEGNWGLATLAYYIYRANEASASRHVQPCDYRDLIGCHIHVMVNMRTHLGATDDDIRMYITNSCTDFSGIIHGLFRNWRSLDEYQRQEMVKLIERTKSIAGYNPYNGWVSMYLVFKDSRVGLKGLCFVYRVYAGIKRRLGL